MRWILYCMVLKNPRTNRYQMQSLKPRNPLRRTRNKQQRRPLASPLARNQARLNVSLAHQLDLVNPKRQETKSVAKLLRARKYCQRRKMLQIRRTLMVTHPGKTFQSLCKTHTLKVVAGAGTVHIVQSLAGLSVVTHHNYFDSLCRLFCWKQQKAQLICHVLETSCNITLTKKGQQHHCKAQKACEENCFLFFGDYCMVWIWVVCAKTCVKSEIFTLLLHVCVSMGLAWKFAINVVYCMFFVLIWSCLHVNVCVFW